MAEPLFRISLFKIRAFTFGNIANLLLAMSRGGMQFMLIIWLQGIWLPLHGYSYEQTPLWAGIYLVPDDDRASCCPRRWPGCLSDRMGAKAFTVGGPLLSAVDLPRPDLPAGELLLLGVRAPRSPSTASGWACSPRPTGPR